MSQTAWTFEQPWPPGLGELGRLLLWGPSAAGREDGDRAIVLIGSVESREVEGRRCLFGTSAESLVLNEQGSLARYGAPSSKA